LSEGDIQVLKNELDHIKEQISDLKEDIKCLRDKTQGRLPVWATALIALLSSMVVWFAK
jgi:hypothetical protein